MRWADSADGTVRGAQSEGGEIDLAALRRALWARKALIILPTLLVMAATIFIVGRLTPLYKSEAQVLIESRDNVYTRPGNADRDRLEADELAIQSQVQLVLSRDLARIASEEAGLAKTSEFNPQGVSFAKRIMVMFGLSRDPLRMSDEERVLQRYYESLNTYAVFKSRVIAIEFSSADPEIAARTANAIADNYLALQQAAKQNTTRQASNWLASEISAMSGRVAEAEAKVEAFRASNNLFQGLNNASLNNQQLGDLTTELVRARAQQSEASAKSAAIRAAVDAGRPIDSLDVANSELIRRLAEQSVTLNATLARESRTFLPAHPRIKELNAQIASLDAQIRDEALKLARGFENEAAVAAARVTRTQAQIDDQKKIAGAASEEEVQLRALEREARAQREILEQFLSRYREASSRESIEALPPDARIISRATVSSTPYFPRPLPIILIATFATLFITTGLVAANEILVQPKSVPPVNPDDRKRPADRDAEASARPGSTIEPAAPHGPSPAPTIAEASLAASNAAKLVRASRQSRAETPGAPQVSGALPVFGRLRRKAQSRRQTRQMDVEAADVRLVGDLAAHLASTPRADGAMNILVVASAQAVDAGAVALDLARSLGAAERKAIIVDASADSAALAAALPGDLDGLSELLAGSSSFGDVIHRDRGSSSHIIPNGRVRLEATEWSRLGIVFDALGLTYDFVLVLAPSSETGVDLSELTRRSGAAILVASGSANAPQTVAAHDELVRLGIEDVVVLLTADAAGDRQPLQRSNGV